MKVNENQKNKENQWKFNENQWKSTESHWKSMKHIQISMKTHWNLNKINGYHWKPVVGVGGMGGAFKL